uniref:MYND-type domain-containing protein n=1 Tax=Clytia hemisphaerica TaxID=252671 RepID=A0A7M5UIQ1_9CNID
GKKLRMHKEKRKISETTVSPRSTSFECSNCSKNEARSRCSRCTAVKYCSKECQKDHWVKHKVLCKDIKYMDRRWRNIISPSYLKKVYHQLECISQCPTSLVFDCPLSFLLVSISFSYHQRRLFLQNIFPMTFILVSIVTNAI